MWEQKTACLWRNRHCLLLPLLSSVSVAIRIPVMIVLVYGWDLPGAAVGVAVTMLIDQGLFLWRTMRHLAVTVVDLLISTWRPVAASLVMVGCLGALGMAWTPGDAATEWRTIEDLVGRCVTGAAVYAVALLLTWLLAGRPVQGVSVQMLCYWDLIKWSLDRRLALDLGGAPNERIREFKTSLGADMETAIAARRIRPRLVYKAGVVISLRMERLAGRRSH